MVSSTIFCEKYHCEIHEQLMPTPTMAAHPNHTPYGVTDGWVRGGRRKAVLIMPVFRQFQGSKIAANNPLFLHFASRKWVFIGRKTHHFPFLHGGSQPIR